MISMLIGTAISLVGLQATIAAPRAAFVTCLKSAASKAASEKVGGDAFKAYVHGACAGQATSLKGAMVAFDVKNGVKRGQSASDADGMLDDYFATSLDNYQARFPAEKTEVAAAPAPVSTPKATPAPTPAAAPK